MIEQRYGKTVVSDDFGGCEESITFQNKGIPQKRSSRARMSCNFGVPGTPGVALWEDNRATSVIDRSRGLYFRGPGAAQLST